MSPSSSRSASGVKPPGVIGFAVSWKINRPSVSIGINIRSPPVIGAPLTPDNPGSASSPLGPVPMKRGLFMLGSVVMVRPPVVTLTSVGRYHRRKQLHRASHIWAQGRARRQHPKEAEGCGRPGLKLSPWRLTCTSLGWQMRKSTTYRLHPPT